MRSVAPVLLLLGSVAAWAQTTPPACTVTLNPASANITSAARNSQFTVQGTPAGCTWTAESNNPDWLTISFGASGVPGGAVGYTATANTAITARTGTIRVNNATFTVNQAAGDCTFSLSATSASMAAGETTAAWITIAGSTTGTGNGTVAYSVEANSGTASRSGTITIGSAVHTITQAGACTFSLLPSSTVFQASGQREQLRAHGY
jgi:hypothetical protein